jgi:chromosome segregation ATPase
MAAHETRINNELERANARVESLEKQIEDVTSERDRQISELHELMTIQTELNDELRLLKGDAGTSRAEKGLFGNQSLTQTRLDDTEEEVCPASW